MAKTNKELKAWEREKRFIPGMIAMYCRGNHKDERKKLGLKHSEVCPECKKLTEYALFRLEKCPFKVNKKFCNFCKIHCYKPDMKEEIRLVMKYSGPRMIFTHPIFAFGHVIQLMKYKHSLKKSGGTSQQAAVAAKPAEQKNDKPDEIN